MSESPIEKIQAEVLKGPIIEVLKTIFDPEIPVSIHELGLIYDLRVQADGKVEIDMTLTSPACPVAGSLPGEVQAKIVHALVVELWEHRGATVVGVVCG